MSQPTITPPQVQGLPLGATSERNAAMVTQQNDANNLNALNNITTGKVGGRRRKRRILRGGFAPASSPSGQFVVPVIQTNYNDPMAGPQSATSQQPAIAGTFNQGSENAKFDAVKLVKGGRRRKSRKSRKSKKSKKSRKSVKSKKYRK